MRVREGSVSDFEGLLACDPYSASFAGRHAVISAALVEGAVLVAEEVSGLVGFAVLDYRFFEMGFVPLVAVAPSARRRGVALALLAAAEAACTTQKLFTSTNESNTVAQALLRRAGFIPSGRVENLDPGDPELIFYKEVGSRDG